MPALDSPTEAALLVLCLDCPKRLEDVLPHSPLILFLLISIIWYSIGRIKTESQISQQAFGGNFYNNSPPYLVDFAFGVLFPFPSALKSRVLLRFINHPPLMILTRKIYGSLNCLITHLYSYRIVWKFMNASVAIPANHLDNIYRVERKQYQVPQRICFKGIPAATESFRLWNFLFLFSILMFAVLSFWSTS